MACRGTPAGLQDGHGGFLHGAGAQCGEEDATAVLGDVEEPKRQVLVFEHDLREPGIVSLWAADPNCAPWRPFDIGAESPGFSRESFHRPRHYVVAGIIWTGTVWTVDRGAASLGFRQREYGLDIARLASMFMVVLLHNLGRGGVLDWSLATRGELIYACLNNAASVAVNVFAIISGYLAVGKKTNWRKVFGLWGIAVFWSVSTALVGLLGGTEPGPWLYRAFFPVLTSRYWYLSSYLVMQLLLPFVCEGIERLEPRRTGRLSVLLVIGCSVLGSIRYDNRAGIGINNGYSVMWLIALWILGAAIKLNLDKINAALRSSVLVGAVLVIPVVLMFLEVKGLAVGIEPHGWIAYVSPLLVVDAICVFLLCQRIAGLPKPAERVLVVLSGSAFGVYLIDTSSWFYDIWLVGRFAWIGELPLVMGLPMLLGMTLLMFVGFLLLETARRKLLAMVKALTKA